MDDQINEIFQQLIQICHQYKTEVPGGRRAWPKSVKERVFALQRAGVNPKQIAERIPVPYMTIASWNSIEKRKGTFLPIKVVRARRKTSKASTVTVRNRRGPNKLKEPARPITTVTVITPSGIRVEGLTADDESPCDLCRLFARAYLAIVTLAGCPQS